MSTRDFQEVIDAFNETPLSGLTGPFLQQAKIAFSAGYAAAVIAIEKKSPASIFGGFEKIGIEEWWNATR